MLNEEINKYKDLYTLLVTEFAALHNQNALFLKNNSRPTGFACSQHLREIERLCKEIKKQSVKVRNEKVANLRLERAARIEAKKNKKKKKKNDVDVSK